MTDKYCLTCVWYDGTESQILQQIPAKCAKHRTVQHADDTCDEHRDYIQPKAA